MRRMVGVLPCAATLAMAACALVRVPALPKPEALEALDDADDADDVEADHRVASSAAVK